jgi:anti-anti-sigma factor
LACETLADEGRLPEVDDTANGWSWGWLVSTYYVTTGSGERPRFRGCLYYAGTGVLVRLVGELDLAATDELEALLRQAAGYAVDSVVLDFSEVTFIDAHCIGLIVSAWHAAQRQHRTLGVAGLHGFQVRMFGILELGYLVLEDAVHERE